MKRKLFILTVTLIALLAAVISPALAFEPLRLTGMAGEELDISYLLSGELDQENLQGIIITELPSSGNLVHNGKPVLEGEAITAAALNDVRFSPYGSYEIETQFSYLPVFSESVGEQPVTVEISMTRGENRPPVAQDMEVKTYKNIAITEMFKATDPDGDQLTFRVTTKSRRGEFEVLPDNTFKYTPYKNKTGSDSVTYVAVDSFGNTSAEARINIKIEKPKTKTTYADMDGQPAHYAAIRLIENKVFTGEQLCGEYYFNPTATVSRGEFVTMIMKAIGAETVPTLATGFYDDSETPSWVKSYAQAALKSGVISGISDQDGRRYLRSEQDISLAEALIMLNNATRIADVNGVTLDEASAIPVWASQAVANMEAVGVIQPQLNDWITPVSRGEAAEMICKAIDVYNANQKPKGLLSWVLG